MSALFSPLDSPDDEEHRKAKEQKERSGKVFGLGKMQWQMLTAIFVCIGFYLIVHWDLVAYVFGSDSETTKKVHDWENKVERKVKAKLHDLEGWRRAQYGEGVHSSDEHQYITTDADHVHFHVGDVNSPRTHAKLDAEKDRLIKE